MSVLPTTRPSGATIACARMLMVSRLVSIRDSSIIRYKNTCRLCPHHSFLSPQRMVGHSDPNFAAICDYTTISSITLSIFSKSILASVVKGTIGVGGKFQQCLGAQNNVRSIFVAHSRVQLDTLLDIMSFCISVKMGTTALVF
jgi:hypothetical protein